jgi:Gas vesicle synthesis protein GvpO
MADQDGRVGIGEAVRAARELLSELTGLKPGTITGVDREEDGWRVTVEMLELERIPNTMDVLGSYEIELGNDGEMRGYRRVKRYHRSATEDSE